MEPNASQPQATPITPPQSKKKVLWVEDDVFISTILVNKFISAGFDIIHAKTAEEAIACLRKDTPDIIIVDILLPKADGFQVLQFIHDDQRLAKIPRMVLSNMSKPADKQRAEELGSSKFLVKPATSLEQVIDEVRKLCL